MIATLRRKAALVLEYRRTFGLGRTIRFLIRRAASRTKVRAANLVLPRRVACPCCDWTGRLFDDYIEVGYRLERYVCPRCGSQPRHRFFHIWLQRSFRLGERAGLSIVFAFERPLAALWDQARHLHAVRTDIATARTVDVVADAEKLPFRSGCADLVWCHHVLEHVREDRTAIRELRRVLRRGTGTLIVSVPMAEAEETVEYAQADPAESGHRRRYGRDFARRLAEAGLRCEAERMVLPEPEMQRYGVYPEPFFICRTNDGQA